MSKFFIHDFETQNIPYYGSLSTPHNPDNYVVATGWCVDGGDIKHKYFNNAEEAKDDSWLDELLQCEFYVCHNATFEIHWMLKHYRDKFLQFLKQGGKVLCTQYAEFLLSNQTHLYPALEDCAVKYGGTKKIDEVKLLWEAGYLTADIDKSLLVQYLADPEVGDIANTRLVLFNQIPELQRRGMWEMFLVRSDSLLFNAFATFNGLYVDMEVARKNQQQQVEAINEIKTSILNLMPDDVPEELDFSFTSAYHLSAFLFGGTVQYQARVSYEPKKYEKVDAYGYTSHNDPNDVIYRPIEDVDIPVRYELITYKSGKNKGLPKIFKVDSTKEKLKWGDKQYTFKGLIDLESLPSNVSEQFLGKRAEFRGKRNLVCGTPVYSTGKDALDVLSVYTEQAKPLQRLAALIKDTGTYYLTTLANGKQSGMLQYVTPEGFIYHSLNNCATVTGRLSGSTPNMQNIPRDGTSRVKEMFVSRWSDGFIVESDYSALEVVTLAAISGDMNLLRMLQEGVDMHCYRLAAKLNEPYLDVLKKCKDKSHPEYTKYDSMRTDIKPRAFAHQYGASPEGIAYSTGCTVEEAIEFKEIEFQLFPESNAYPIEVVRPMVEKTGLLERPRVEYLEDGTPQHYLTGYFQAKSGTCYAFRQFSKWDKDTKSTVMDYKDTQIANYWNQGEASFIVQASCGLTLRWALENDFFDGKALPINTVHDAQYWDCATEEIADMVGRKVQEIMEATPKWLAKTIPALQDWNYHSTPFPSSSEKGKNMMSKVDIV